MNKNHFFSYFAVFAAMLFAGSVVSKASIIPEPVVYEKKRGSFTLQNKTDVFFLAGNELLAQNAAFLAGYLAKIENLEINLKPYQPGLPLPNEGIVLALSPQDLQPEGYELTISKKRILIEGYDEAGVFYGIQTLRQLLPESLDGDNGNSGISKVKLKALYIKDYPQFAYRGMHLDVARHFFDAEYIKKFLELMALHKMNRFHWHLTDDQGWRIEIKQYPLLTEVGAWRKETMTGHLNDEPRQFDGIPYGGFFTQEEIIEIVAFASERFITVIPEIEMPGHATAALAGYPELGCTGGPYEVGTIWGIYEEAFCAGKDQTFEFLENVLTEVTELFPSEYIHIGGDEVLKNHWKECELCQARIAKEGLTDEDELQGYFINRIGSFLQSKDRKIIGWDEILDGELPQGAAVMSWRGVRGGIEAAKMGHDVIMTPVSHSYFDFYQDAPETEPLAIGGYLTLRQVYSFQPIPQGMPQKEARHILGGQANVWTEYINSEEHLEYMVFPRAVAMAEVLWTPKEKHDFEGFIKRLNKHYQRLDALDVNYHGKTP